MRKELRQQRPAGPQDITEDVQAESLNRKDSAGRYKVLESADPDMPERLQYLYISLVPQKSQTEHSWGLLSTRGFLGWLRPWGAG